jgi:hypothetical protein
MLGCPGPCFTSSRGMAVSSRLMPSGPMLNWRMTGSWLLALGLGLDSADGHFDYLASVAEALSLS